MRNFCLGFVKDHWFILAVIAVHHLLVSAVFVLPGNAYLQYVHPLPPNLQTLEVPHLRP